MFTATLNILLCPLLEDRTLTKFTFTGANMYKTFSSKLVHYSLSRAAIMKNRIQTNRETFMLYICFVFYTYDVRYVLLLFIKHHIYYNERIS